MLRESCRRTAGSASAKYRCPDPRRTKVPWDELDDRYRQDSLARAQACLGDAQLHHAYAHGMTLSLDQTLELAPSRATSG